MAAPTLTLAEAARATGLSQSTIRRNRPRLLELGAFQGKDSWQIPVTALIAAGLMPATTGPDPVTAPDSPQQEAPAPSTAPVTVGEVEALREALAAAERRAAVAEAIAAERDRIIEAQALALRMLEAPQQAPAQAKPQQPAAGETHQVTPAPQPAGKPWQHVRSLARKLAGKP